MKKSLLFLTLILAMSINAQTTYNVSEDAYVRGGDHADVTHGTTDEGLLEVKTGNLSSFFRRSLVKFDLKNKGINAAAVQNATLRLYTSKINADPVTISASETTDGWKENEVTWNNAPASGALIGATVITDKDVFYEWDVTAYVKAQLNGDEIVSICLEELTAANDEINFNSKEADSNAPELVINTTLSTSSFEVEKKLFSVYPNPATDVLNIKVASGELKTLTIFDVTGKSLYVKHAVKNSSQINISWLSNGMYLMKAESENGTQLLKFIK